MSADLIWLFVDLEEGFGLTFSSMAAIQAFFALGTFIGPVIGGTIVTVSSTSGSPFLCTFCIAI